MMATGSKAKDMVKVFIHTQVEMFMKEIGLTEKRTVKASTNSPVETSTKVIGSKVKDMTKEYTHQPMVNYMMDNGLKVKSTVKEYLNMLMEL